MSKFLNQLVNQDLRENAESDHIYVDFSIVSNRADGQPVPIIFNDARNSTILENPCEYYVAVVRFHIDTFNSIPAIIPQVQLNQTDINLTVYSFTLQYKTFQYQAYLEFIPQNVNAKLPTGNLPYQDNNSKYYFVNSYSYMVTLLNNTLQAAFSGLQSAVTGESLPTDKAPFILYDSVSSQCVFNGDAAAYDTKLENPIYIYANPQMYNLLSGFEWKNYGYSEGNGMVYQLQIYNNFNTNVLEMSDTYNLIQCYEEYNSIVMWSPVANISFSSSTIPLEQTIINDTQRFNSNTSMNVNSSNVTAPIITDFTVALDKGKEYLPSIDYISPPQYRLVSCFGHGSIKNLQLSVYWRDNYGNNYPLELSSGAACNIKLLFRKKSFNG